MDVDLKILFGKLDPQCYAAMDAAAAACVSRGSAEVTVEDLLLQLLDQPDCDLSLILRHYDVNAEEFRKALHGELGAGEDGSGKPVFSGLLIRLLREAWLLATTSMGLEQIRSGLLLLVLRQNPQWYGLKSYGDLVDAIPAADLASNLSERLAGSSESAESGAPSAASGHGDSALARFTVDFSAKAVAGELDPVFCRDREIRQMVDILSRRRKNNPILVGDPGVGKSAVVEGLALRIAAGEVPDSLKAARLLSLDLGLLQAGAGVKGEFEKRLRAVLDEAKSSPDPVILFIDEAHTLIGAGGQAGSGDAANLLKPALARGELRAIAATTWSEYRKYFEKDPALARRFQLVKLAEPTPDEAVTIIRGLRSVYEKAHGVYVRDDAIRAAATMAARYITGRQLPDKAVDVLDTACARVALGLSSKPDSLEDVEQRIGVLEREHAARSRDVEQRVADDDGSIRELDASIAELKSRAADLQARWEHERELVHALVEQRQALERADEKKRVALAKQIDESRQALAELTGDGSLVPFEVTPEIVSRVVADWTGVPLGKLVRDEASVLAAFPDHMRGWVKGQEHAVERIGECIRTAKAGLANPEAPMGVFLLVGPSGVGKTETATAVAELLFGGRQALTVINMSEFQERHTISRLIGSPPGYVGYGEGGVLSEAVRQRPYSVVLLDEIEKSDVEVLNLFYQVFDKGMLNDGEGREIDFRNTVIFLTSNLGTERIMEACADGAAPDAEELADLIRPELTRFLKPALLGRMQVVPFFPISDAVLRQIITAKLAKVRSRLRGSQGLEFTYEEALEDFVAQRCTAADSGARNIDHVINRYVLPEMAKDVLSRLESTERVSNVHVSVDGERVQIGLS